MSTLILNSSGKMLSQMQNALCTLALQIRCGVAFEDMFYLLVSEL